MVTARREEIEWVRSDGVNEIVPMQDCKDAGKELLELIWLDTDKSVDPAHKKIGLRLCAKKKGRIQKTSLASQLFSAMPPLEAVKVLCLNHDVCELVEQRKTILKLQPEDPTSRSRSSEIW